MVGSNDAVIRVRLDTASAEADLRRLESAFGKVQGAAHVGFGVTGSGAGKGSAPGGFAGGFSLGSLLPTIGGISLGAAAFGTLAGDAFSGAKGALDPIGREISRLFGLDKINSSMRAADRAAAMASEAFGPVRPTDAAARSVYNTFKTLTEPEEATKRQFEDLAAGDKSQTVFDLILKAIQELPEKIAEATHKGVGNTYFDMTDKTNPFKAIERLFH